ncbi:ATPase family AAA domain-containing protein 2 [Phyllosticta citrichinensis]|uniref:ATPase family AAA domain-containing protein 2 n=1 Tax=Phyllosticta citrichinensis TaxID=1130410 RepID=A0ABR1XN21_9PEZI
MPTHKERLFTDFDPNKSDSNDEDFEDNPSSPPRRHRSRTKATKFSSKQPKRVRRSYRDSDGDIVEDDESDLSEKSYESNSSHETEVAERNPRTGRPVRSAIKNKQVKYEEKSEEDIEEIEDGSPEPPKLIVRLRVPPKALEISTGRTTRRSTRAASKSLQSSQPSRRSARLSEDRELPLQSLQYPNLRRSSRATRSKSPQQYHQYPRRDSRATRSKTPQSNSPQRPNVGRKGPRPSTIMEASQENSGPSFEANEHEDQEAQHGAASPTSEIQYEGQKGKTATPPAAPADENPELEEEVVKESEHGSPDEDSDEGPIAHTRTQTAKVDHSTRRRGVSERELMSLQGSFDRPNDRKRKSAESSDFEPGDDDDKQDDELSDSDQPPNKRQKTSSDESIGQRSSRRSRAKSSQQSRRRNDSDDEIDQDELADEAAALAKENKRSRRERLRQRPEAKIVYDHAPRLRNRVSKVDYKIANLQDIVQQDELAEEAADAVMATPSRNRGGRKTAGGWRPLFSVQGPFGGIGGRPPLLGGPSRAEPLGEFDSDSSDDDVGGGQAAPSGMAGAIGKTPDGRGLLVPTKDNAQKGFGGGPADFGKINPRKQLADTDPLSVNQDITFDSVGGLEDHINQLKEMVTLPLTYPEIFRKFKTTPPRGVLFHGPPGTGKTLLARALANAVSANGGKKVTFYMRKGADALSKWVGEAERQLRMLFEEARKNQPSIIFFDEIDGIAPVRSSRSEQIHASIVATLLALMDGMDDRGQVVVIGATNRPDSVDPALRRPGRFDREFYFPLPNADARRAIIDIHTKDWSPPLDDNFKNQLAHVTKGYGGADLRALCTEAAVNAVQGTFPQIYQSSKKLVIDVDKIKVSAKDFMISLDKIVPSSERSTSVGAAPLSKTKEPLLRQQLMDIVRVIDEVIPPKKKLTALEEAQYDDRDDNFGFERENLRRDFENGRVFRPRLLIRGSVGMGQQDIGAALLHKFEGMHVQSFDLPNLLGEAGSSPEATLVQLFKEVRRHKPSVIYIPNVDVWYSTVSREVITTFTGLLRTMPATDPVLVLGTMEQLSHDDKPDPEMVRNLFGFSLKNQFELKRPDVSARKEYFGNVVTYIRKSPKEFPDTNRKKRKFEELAEAEEPAAPPIPAPSKDELKALKKRDRHVLNLLKIAIQPIMEQLKQKYRKFRNSVIDDSQIRYLYEEENPEILTTDVPDEMRLTGDRPFELAYDRNGEKGLLEVATKKFYYNLNLAGIEERLSNGYYKRPRDFLDDIHKLARDAKNLGDVERVLKANEILTNVEVDISKLEYADPELWAACEQVYQREQERLKKLQEKARAAGANGQEVAEVRANVPPAHGPSQPETESTGPIVLGEHVPGQQRLPVTPTRRIGPSPLSNGVTVEDRQRESNGTGGGTDETRGEDSQEQDSSIMEQHRDKRLRLDEHSGPDIQGTQGTQGSQGFNRSQRSGHTQMVAGTHPGDYQNSASTTTSGQKTSDRSHRSSAPFTNTQSTNGVGSGAHPDFASGPAQSGGSEIPDTQEAFASSQPTGSQPSQSSQTHFATPSIPQSRPQTAISSLLNNSESQEQPSPKLILDEDQLITLHDELSRRSSGLSVEQLEQVNSAIMQAIWNIRGEWNRNIVLQSAMVAFNDTIKDIEEMQRVFDPSQPE